MDGHLDAKGRKNAAAAGDDRHPDRHGHRPDDSERIVDPLNRVVLL
jgi:hypothetical protein